MENFETPKAKTGLHQPKKLFGVVLGTGATNSEAPEAPSDEILSEVLVPVDQDELPDLLVTGQLLDDDDVHITSPEDEEEQPRSVLREIQSSLVNCLMNRGKIFFKTFISMENQFFTVSLSVSTTNHAK